MESTPGFLMKKKLLFVVTKSNWGGAGRYVFDLAVSLSEEYEVTVALGGSGALFQELKKKDIRTIPIPSLNRDLHMDADSAAFFELLTIFKKERPDIVHLNSSKAGGLGALAARMSGVPRIIYTAHGWAFNEQVPIFSKIFRWTTSLITLILTHRVITVCHFDEIHSPLGLETTMIHNGLTKPVFFEREKARREITMRAGIAENDFLIGTIAELHTNKGIDILILAFAHERKGHLIVIGEGEERVALQTLIKKLNLETRVHLLGFIPDAATLLKAFDMFVLSSRKEGLPYVLLEAGEAEVAAIAPMVGGIPEIIDDQLSGVLVPAYDVHALTEAINELENAPGTRAHYATRLKEKVERYFPLAGMVKKTVEVYES